MASVAVLYIFRAGPAPRRHITPNATEDMQLLRWSDLGPLTVYPDSEWDYIKATWSPWFEDSSHLAYVSGSTLVISAPDGNAKRMIPIDGQAGLATPSPDGKYVAYLTFSSPDENTSGFTILGRQHHLGYAARAGGKADCCHREKSCHDLRSKVDRQPLACI